MTPAAPPPAATLASSALVARAVRPAMVATLLVPMLMFGQVFHYVKQVMPLWALSKAFPVITLPLALILLGGRRPPGSRQILLSFLWLLIVPSLIATQTFGQDFFRGLTAEVKLLPILYFFSVLGLLRWLSPTPKELFVTFAIAAIGTFVVLVALWLLAPQSAYSTHYVAGDSPLLAVDNRGNRIRLPMYFGLLGIFYCYRRFLARWQLRWFIAAALGFAGVLLLVRMRSTVLGLVGVAAINTFLAASTRMRMAFIALLPFALAGLFSIPYIASVFSTDSSMGFDVRWITTMKSLDFLGNDPLRWIFGVGSLSPLDPAGMMTWFNHFFFLADITWVGVVFEFGLLGALLILMLGLRGLLLLQQARATGDSAALAALQDYLLYALLISEFFPMTMAPGELTLIMAIGVWVTERQRRTWARVRIAAAAAPLPGPTMVPHVA